MKKVFIASFLFISILISCLLICPQTVFCDGLSDAQTTPAKVKAPKKTKKNHKKVKAGKMKVSKTAAGAQDEVSDQTDVSQQADQSGNKKKR